MVSFGAKIRGRTTQLVPVSPKLTHLLIYPGGYCGEFIGYWLSQHPGCMPAVAESLPNNRYVHRFNQTFIVSTALAHTSQDRLFLLAHPPGDPKDAVTFNGIPQSAITNQSFIWCSGTYKKFFFLLMWVKMRLYKFSLSAINAETGTWPAHIARQFTDTHTGEDFQNYIQGRNWFYQFELDSFKRDQVNTPVLDRAQREFKYYNLATKYENWPKINLDELMFGNVEHEHQRICEYYGLDYELSRPMTPMIQQYHQRNLDVAQRFLQIPVNEFIKLSNQDAWPHIESAVIQAHSLLV